MPVGTFDITGVGPVLQNGNTQIFTTQGSYQATPAQITAFTRTPVLGDQLNDQGNGAFTLISNPGSIAAESDGGAAGSSEDGGQELI